MMKYSINIVAALIFLLPLSCFGKTDIAAQKTIYMIEESQSIPNTLTVSVIRSSTHLPVQLVLGGTSMGIANQVKNMTCDGKSIQEEKSGIWTAPSNCRKIQWDVPLRESGVELASAQQSMKSDDFVLFSEASSLPRIQDANANEVIKISIHNIKSIFPAPNSLGELPLSKKNSAPLFVIINPAMFDSNLSDSINLTYLLDNKSAISKLPSMSAHAKGLEWLSSIMHKTSKEDFTIVWLGISAEKVSLAGATGDGILLTNYASDGKLPNGNAMLLYVTLHEAFHQLAVNNLEQPAWAAESLASYYGIKALQVSLPNDPDTSKLLERFLTGADHFKDGLIIINRRVAEGDRSEYGAFYTKGIAFWIAVDEALKQKNDSLDNHLLDVMQTKYDLQGEPLNLQNILNLSPEVWTSLRRRFLD